MKNEEENFAQHRQVPRHQLPIIFTDAAWDDADSVRSDSDDEWFMAHMVPGGIYTHTSTQDNPSYDVDAISLRLLSYVIDAYRAMDGCQPYMLACKIQTTCARNKVFFGKYGFRTS